MPDTFDFFSSVASMFLLVTFLFIFLVVLVWLVSPARKRQPGAVRRTADPFFPLEMNRGINEPPGLPEAHQHHHHHHEAGFSPISESHHHHHHESHHFSPPSDPPPMHHHQ